MGGNIEVNLSTEWKMRIILFQFLQFLPLEFKMNFDEIAPEFAFDLLLTRFKYRGGIEVLSRGYRGPWPSEPPANPQPTPRQPPRNLKQIPDEFKGFSFEKTDQIHSFSYNFENSERFHPCWIYRQK